MTLVSGSAVTSTATSTATESRGTTSIANAVVRVPGLVTDLLTASSLSAEAICPTDRTAPTTATVGLPATVVVAGDTVTVDASTPVTVTAGVGVAGSSVTLDFDTRTVTTDTAASTALVMTVNVIVAGVATTTGTITLAQATCERPALPAPTALSLAPPSGPTAGGTTVTVTGSNFVPGATTVTIGGVTIPATAVTVGAGGTTLTFVTPARETAGPVSVVVTTAAGSTPPLTYTYVAPTLTTVSPSSGPTFGGTSVTLTGTGFTGATGVTFDGVPATGVVVVSDTTITMTTPAGAAGAAGAADVVVVLPGADATKLDGYTYVAPPVATGITPDSGPTGGGQTVTITGSGFVSGGTTVTFDGVPATGVTVVSSTQLTAVTPPGTRGPADVVVTTAGGSSAPLDYTYVAGAGSGGSGGGGSGGGGSGSVDDGDGSGSDGGSSDPSSDETTTELGGLPSTGGGRVVLIGLAGLLALTAGSPC